MQRGASVYMWAYVLVDIQRGVIWSIVVVVVVAAAAADLLIWWY